MPEKSKPQRFNAYNHPHEDLREFIKRAEEAGEILRISGAGRQIRDKASSTNSRAVIDACRPFERLKDFPAVARASPELVKKVHEKFADVLAKIGV